MNFLNCFKNVSIVLGVFAFGVLPAFAQTQPTNIALRKVVTFSDKPNYALTTDPEDHLQITDGKYSSEGDLKEVENSKSIWVQKGTVGWQGRNPVVITIDLGKGQAISGASFSTAAGHAKIEWPRAIHMAVSQDKETWHPAGELISLAGEESIPPLEGYAAFRYTTHKLHTHGRYVSFTVVGVPSHIFVDEIEIYSGDSSWMNEPLKGEAISDLKEYATQNTTLPGIKQRLRSDATAIRSLVAESAISDQQKKRLTDQLDRQKPAIDAISSVPAGFKAIVPLNDTHRKILAVHGAMMALQGQKPLTVWKQHRYAWLPLLGKPQASEKAALQFSMLRDQVRSDALFLTNAGTEARTVSLQLSDPPKTAQPGWLKVDSVEWTDTQNGTVVADALVPVEEKSGIYSVTVPAGLTRKIWLTVDSSKVQTGSTRSVLEIKDHDVDLRVPVTFDFSSIAMDKPRLSLTMWDYTNDGGSYGVNPKNREASIELMRSHFLDSPWGSYRVLPFPQAEDFDAENNLVGELDFTSLDEWLAQWPDARRYFIYRNLWGSKSFVGAHIESPEFAERVGSWARAVVDHIKGLGLDPSKFNLQFVDEPHTGDQDAVAVAWTKAVRAAAPELKLFSNPMWARPDQTKIQDAITMMDALCPLLHKYRQGGEPVQQYYADLQSKGKELWFYATRGPIRLLDPQMYYRYQAWHTFAVDGQGHGAWSFGSIGKAASSWNEYSATGLNYAPVFFDEETVHNSVHWDSMREGMEDHEELAMLRDAITASKNAALKAKAQQLLDKSVQTITSTWKDNTGIYSWDSDQYDPHLADNQLKKVRVMLEKLKR